MKMNIKMKSKRRRKKKRKRKRTRTRKRNDPSTAGISPRAPRRHHRFRTPA